MGSDSNSKLDPKPNTVSRRRAFGSRLTSANDHAPGDSAAPVHQTVNTSDRTQKASPQVHVQNSNSQPRIESGYPAVCSNCGVTCKVPFKPIPGRPVYCNRCFKNHGPGCQRLMCEAAEKRRENSGLWNRRLHLPRDGA